MYFSIPERRTDHLTRAIIDAMIGQLRQTQAGLMFYSDLTKDARAIPLLETCDNEIIYYMQRLSTIESETR